MVKVWLIHTTMILFIFLLVGRIKPRASPHMLSKCITISLCSCDALEFFTTNYAAAFKCCIKECHTWQVGDSHVLAGLHCLPAAGNGHFICHFSSCPVKGRASHRLKEKWAPPSCWPQGLVFKCNHVKESTVTWDWLIFHLIWIKYALTAA